MSDTLTPESLLELSFIANPYVVKRDSDANAPTQGLAVCTRIATANNKPPKYLSSLRHFDLLTQTPSSGQPFTREWARLHTPKLDMQGDRLAFIAGNDLGEARLYLMPIRGGEAQAITPKDVHIESFIWHPNGQELFAIARPRPTPPSANETGIKTFERLRYKMNGLGLIPPEIAQLYHIHLLNPLGGAKTTCLSELTQNPRHLLLGTDTTHLLFTAPDSDEEEAFAYNNLWRFELEDKTVHQLLGKILVLDQPTLSPDKTRIAYRAPVQTDNASSPRGLWVWPLDGSRTPEPMSGELETFPSPSSDSQYGHYPNPITWLSDTTLLCTINWFGESHLNTIDTTTLAITPLTSGKRIVTSYAHHEGLILFTAETPERPGELFALCEGNEHQVSYLNSNFCQRYNLQKQQDVQLLATERPDQKVPYWCIPAATPREDQALILQIHGGPAANYGYGFLFEFHMLSHAGYKVVYGNPRGGSSYGTDYHTLIQGGYGQHDARDVLAIAKDAREKYSHPDAPIHITGGSYGGFMTNWLISHSQMFRSAVTQRSICNWVSFFGTSDIGHSFTPTQQGGNPWQHTQHLWDQSPLKYVANVSTPVLIIHAEQDMRCPIEQAEQWYTALMCLGKAPTALMRIPGENHHLSRSGRPDRRIERLKGILGWFERHA